MQSLYHKALCLFDEITETIDTHYSKRKKAPPCSKGCASCCSQFFEVSELEFLLILESIDQMTVEEKNDLADKSEVLFDLFKEYWPEFHDAFFTSENIQLNNDAYYTHPSRFEIVMPCIFLSAEGACTIYDRRPFTCRTTGVGYQQLINTGAICTSIRYGLFTPLWQADLRPFVDRIDEIRWLKDEEHPDVYKRQYPLFYFVYNALVNSNFDKYMAQLKAYQG